MKKINQITIRQGSSNPIVANVGYDLSDASTISAELVQVSTVLKSWSFSSLETKGSQVILPLDDTESSDFPAGYAKLIITYTVSQNVVVCTFNVKIKEAKQSGGSGGMELFTFFGAASGTPLNPNLISVSASYDDLVAALNVKMLPCLQFSLISQSGVIVASITDFTTIMQSKFQFTWDYIVPEETTGIKYLLEITPDGNTLTAFQFDVTPSA